MKALGNFVVETNDGNGWKIESDPLHPEHVVHTRKRAREIRQAYQNILATADKPYRVRVVPVK